MTTTDKTSEQQIRELLDEAGIPVAVEVTSRIARLIGPVDSERLRQAAIDLASSVNGIRRVEDDMNYEVVSPDMVTEPNDDDEQFGYADALSLMDDVSDEEADFAGSPGTTDQIQAVEEGETYFAPIDPVVEPSRRGSNLEIIGGFQSEATDDTDEEEEEAFEDSVAFDAETRVIDRDDDDIQEDVLRELREDAETTTLNLDVRVVRGVVFLRGKVQSIDDAENAESVASRIPGVVSVEDRTDVVE
ncbi:MAG: BON domain-containing protein [Nitrolancea sp.]